MKYTPTLTVNRAAKYLGVSGRQVRRYCRDGVLEAYHAGAEGTWSIPLSELVRLRPIGPADPRALEGIDLKGPSEADDMSNPSKTSNPSRDTAKRGTIEP